MNRRELLVLASLVLAAVLPASSARGASGGPDAFGYTWQDVAGCSTSIAGFGTGSTTVPTTSAMQGPYMLGFTMPYFGLPVDRVWVSPYGYVTFTGTGGPPNIPTPGQLPTAGPPNTIAVHWANVPNTTITTEAVPGEFRVRWQQHLTSTATQTSYLFLSDDGSWRMTWRGSFQVARSIGYKNSGNPTLLGTNLYYEPNTSTIGDEVVAPGYPTPSASQATCITPPVLLDCSMPLVATCNTSVAGTLPAADSSPASVYTCSGTTYQGNERVVQVNVASPSQVSVSIDNAALDLLQIGPGPCNESNCVAQADNRIDYPFLFPGTYTYVVDKTAAGGGDSFNFRVDCTDPFVPIACGDSQAGSTSGANVFSTYTCAAVALLGPEKLYSINLPVQQNLVATLQTAVPDLWVVLYARSSFDAGGPCLAAGRGGAGVFDAPAGDYVIVVDGANAASGNYTIDIACGPQLDCAGATPISCSSTVSGDTGTAPRRVAVYNCVTEALTGGEHVYSFVNPVEQTIDARFLSQTPGQRMMLMPECGEGNCLLTGEQGLSCSLFPPGNYFLIVDGTSSGPYEIQLSCSEIFTGVDLRVAEIDTSALANDCSTFDVDATMQVQVANLGNADAAAGFDVIVFEDRLPLNGRFDLGLDNLLGRTTVGAPLPRGQSRAIDVPVLGTVLFRDNVIFAEVDPTGVVGEVSETNNLWDTGRGCEYRPPVGLFTPTVEWEWNSSADMPTYTAVDTVPLVADVNGDGVPDVVFVSGDRPGGFGDAVVRAVDGRTGTEIFTASGTDCRIHASSNLALADLSGDTLPEIVGSPGTELEFAL